MTVKEICEFFWKLEEKYELVSDSHKAKAWLPVRFPIYYYVTMKTGLFEDPHPDKSARKQRNRGEGSKRLFVPFSNKKFALFPSSRKIAGEDIYSTELLKIIGLDTDILDQGSIILPGAYVVDKIHIVADKIFPMFFRFGKRFFISDEIIVWLNEIADNFNLSRKHLKLFFIRRSMQFFILEKLYLVLFTLRRYKKIYMVGTYFRMHVVSAARKKGIAVAELQHGVITPYHLGYSYPNREKNIFFPDELICMGKFWTDYTPIPSDTRLELIRPSFIERLSSFSAEKRKQAGKVVFNSQGVIGKDIFSFALEVAKLCPELEVVFRLHPSEILEKYQESLSGRDSLSNFKLSHRDPNIFALMAEAEFVVGVFSTTLFEAMVLGCKIILLDMTGIEYMKPVIDRGEALLVQSPLEFRETYHSARTVSDSSYYYTTVSSIV